MTPNAKELQVVSDLKNKKSPSDEYTPNMLELHKHLKASCICEHCLTAFRIREDVIQREIVESLLLVNCPPESIEIAFQVPAKAIEVYQELFFDVRVFQSKLDKISYIESYKDAFGKELKLRALSLGHEFVFYTYGGLLPSAGAQRELMQRMFMSSAYKAMSMHFNSATAAASKQATEFAKLMLKTHETLEKFGPADDGTGNELHQILLSEVEEIALRHPEINQEEIV